jgi:hypothetical protein
MGNPKSGIQSQSDSLWTPKSQDDGCSQSLSANAERAHCVNGRTDHTKSKLEQLHHIEQSLLGTWPAKRRCLEDSSAAGQAAYGSSTSLVSPIKQFVDRARNLAISSSLQSKCLSTVSSCDNGTTTVRDSVLRYVPAADRQPQAAANVPLDLSMKKAKFPNKDLSADRTPMTYKGETVQDEPLDLSKPLPPQQQPSRPVNNVHHRPHRELAPQRSHSSASATLSNSVTNVRQSSSHRASAAEHQSSTPVSQ